MLELKKMGHAFLMATKDNQSILFDPWFGQPLNYKTFYPYPEIEPLTDTEKANVIAIHISHIHDDHLQEDTLKCFKKSMPILISKYSNSKMKDKISNLGFLNIIEIEAANQDFKIGPFGITVFPKIFFDGSFDSSVVLTVDEKNYYIANDCIHPNGFYKILKLMFPKFEGAFIGFTSISPFSWCIDFSGCKQFKTKVTYEKIQHVRQEAVWKHVQTVSRLIIPNWLVPYSSDYSFAHSELIEFNRLFDKASEILKYNLESVKPLVLHNGDKIQIYGNDTQIIQATEKIAAPLTTRGSWIEENCEEIDFPLFIEAAKEYFMNFFSSKSKKWTAPMTILVSFYETNVTKKICYAINSGAIEIVNETTPADLILSYPARAFNGVLQKRWSLREFHVLFLFRAKWNTYKHGQMDLNTW